MHTVQPQAQGGVGGSEQGSKSIWTCVAGRCRGVWGWGGHTRRGRVGMTSVEWLGGCGRPATRCLRAGDGACGAKGADGGAAPVNRKEKRAGTGPRHRPGAREARGGVVAVVGGTGGGVWMGVCVGRRRPGLAPKTRELSRLPTACWQCSSLCGLVQGELVECWKVYANFVITRDWRVERPNARGRGRMAAGCEALPAH